MTRNLSYNASDVEQHIEEYVKQAFPIQGTTWRYKWEYTNGDDTVSLIIWINGKKQECQVPVNSIVR